MAPAVVALYRVSSEAQADPKREGLPAQRRTCQQVARAHGLTIVDSLELRGVSGAAVLDDPRFRAALATDSAIRYTPLAFRQAAWAAVRDATWSCLNFARAAAKCASASCPSRELMPVRLGPRGQGR